MPTVKRLLIAQTALNMAILLFLSLATGCGVQLQAVDGPTDAAKESRAQSKPDKASKPDEAHEPFAEFWNTVFLRGDKVGHLHYKATEVPAKTGMGKWLHFEVENEITIKRFGQSTKQRLLLSNLETKDGQLLEFSSQYQPGTAPIKVTGRYDDEDGESLEISVQTEGKAETSWIKWDKSWGGFFAVEQSLMRQPMKPGEKRTIKALQPVFNQMGEVQLEAVDWEETDMLTGQQELLRVESSVSLAGQQFKQTMWTDRAGGVLKTHDKILGLMAYRTTKEIALKDIGELTFDLGEMSVVRVKRKLTKAHDTKRIVYRAHLKDDEIKGAFPVGATQSVELLDENTAKITVQAIRPDQPEALAAPADPPSDAERQPNSLIQSDNGLIVEMAREVVPTEENSWKVAKALEKLVDQKISTVNFSQAFLPAAEVAKSLEGDCTEHAVLLAALCRAREIPARVAIGLVHFGGGFAYHMWTEVWIDDRWIPLDATLGKGGIGAAHIKLADSSLKGANAYSAFLPVTRIMGRLELEVLEVE